MPSLRALSLLVFLFMLVVLVRLPASWITHALPARLSCDSPSGTVWNGRCDTVHVDALALRNLTWELLPGELLHAKLGVRLRLDDPLLQASGKALLNPKRHVQGYDLLARLPLPSALAKGMPAGWSGLLELDIPRFEVQGDTLEAATGTVRLRQLRQAQPAIAYGSFEWRLEQGALADGHLSGALQDLGDGVRLQGRLSVGLKGDYDLNAKAAAAPGASEALQQLLQQLGPVDAQGFHPLLAAGTL